MMNQPTDDLGSKRPNQSVSKRLETTLHRRQLLAAGGALLTSCGGGPQLLGGDPKSRLDRLLIAHADCLPEAAGAGANHYPMAAEALEALGYEDSIDESWIVDAANYAGELGREKSLTDETSLVSALGHYERFGDWLDYFRAALEREPWPTVVSRWAPRLAPAICAAAFHGVIRAGHAVRALRQDDNAARREELAVGLAYWAARYVELPTAPREQEPSESFGERLRTLRFPWSEDRTDVGFSDVVSRLTRMPVAPPVSLEASSHTVEFDLQEIVREAALAFLEMLVLERNRIWLLHTVTGPAAVQWLLPEVDPAGARKLVEYARQAVIAMYSAYGEPFAPGAHLRDSFPALAVQVERAVDSRSVHGIKLLDALVRFESANDPVWGSVAAQWFEWT